MRRSRQTLWGLDVFEDVEDFHEPEWLGGQCGQCGEFSSSLRPVVRRSGEIVMMCSDCHSLLPETRPPSGWTSATVAVIVLGAVVLTVAVLVAAVAKIVSVIAGGH